MEQVRGRSIADLPLVDWDEGATQCGEESFFIDLLGCFYGEGIPHLRTILQAAIAYRRGTQQFAAGRDRMRSIETLIREESHALKGSAANLRLWKVAKAAENCELPMKALSLSAAVDPSERDALLQRFCFPPSEPIAELVHEYRSFAAYLEGHVRGLVEASEELKSAISEESLPHLLHASAASLDAALADLSAFWDNPAAAADPLPVSSAAGDPSAATMQGDAAAATATAPAAVTLLSAADAPSEQAQATLASAGSAVLSPSQQQYRVPEASSIPPPAKQTPAPAPPVQDASSAQGSCCVVS